RLSLLVVFSAGMGYMLGHNGAMDWNNFVIFLIGGLLITGASNTINQIIERDLDKLMSRTCKRPLPTGRLSVNEAIGFALLAGSAGFLLMLVYINTWAALLSLLSLILYGFVYTPLKRVSSIAVLVGAFPGALPPLIGWAAATNGVSILGLV